MVGSRSRIARFLFYGLTCALICAVFASELPEQLTLTNDTSNDYTLRSPRLSKSIQPKTSARQALSFFLTPVTRLTLWQSSSAVLRDCSLFSGSLFILHSVLRT
jgi:hypothetical protein